MNKSRPMTDWERQVTDKFIMEQFDKQNPPQSVPPPSGSVEPPTMTKLSEDLNRFGSTLDALSKLKKPSPSVEGSALSSAQERAAEEFSAGLESHPIHRPTATAQEPSASDSELARRICKQGVHLYVYGVARMIAAHVAATTATARAALSQEVEDGKRLRELLEQMLNVAENADETGYVTDCGFVDLDKLHAAVRAAIK